MIQINLLPGAARKSKSHGGFSLKGFATGAASRTRDPYLLSAIVAVLLAVGGVGTMHLSQSSNAMDLGLRETAALRDSTRYAMVLKERRRAEAKRDSVMKQLTIIRSIDNDRYVWPHILDEVSRSLPPYTWLKSIQQTSAVAVPAALLEDQKKKEKADTTARPGKKDEAPVGPLRFRLIGNTVDIQALTRFMKLLETSPFLQNVQLAKSELVILDGKEVTEFQLDAEFERPDKSVITTAPVSLSVR
ncbi:MAG: PilN domain-containing protein [Gemmatimonadaceae bacterium]|nr:PilN domain-containing protein [Gemmatimonadaceae bacterium]